MSDVADGPTQATFAFVDLAGFTALDEAHDDEETTKLIFRHHGLALTALIRWLTAAAADPPLIDDAPDQSEGDYPTIS